MQGSRASFSCCRTLYPTPPNHHDSSILFPTFLSERLIYTALSLCLLESHLLTCSLSLTSSSCCGSLFPLVLCLRSTIFPPDPPQSRRTCSLIHVSVLRLFFSSLVFQVTLLTLVSPRFLSPRGSSFPLLSPQPCSPASCSTLMGEMSSRNVHTSAPFPAPARVVSTLVHQHHASVTVLDIDFVGDHHRHRIHELLRPHCCLLPLSIFLSVRHIIFSTLFLAFSSLA